MVLERVPVKVGRKVGEKKKSEMFLTPPPALTPSEHLIRIAIHLK